MINKPDHKPDRDDRDNHANDNGENKRADRAIALRAGGRRARFPGGARGGAQ